MTDDQLNALWGESLFNYCYAKSVQIVGFPSYEIMTMIAVGKIKDVLGAQLLAVLGS